MKFSCVQNDLADAIALTVRAAAVQTSMPILTSILLMAEGDELRLSAMNLKIGISCWLKAKVEQAGSVALPARLFGEVIGKLSRGPVHIELNERTQVAYVRQDSIEVKVAGIQGDHFPLLPDTTSGDCIKFEPRLLRQALEQAAFAASRDESRPIVNCVKWEVQPDHLLIAATDGYRLAVRQVSPEHPWPHKQAITLLIPIESTEELLRVLGAGGQDAIELHMDDDRAVFQVKSDGGVSRVVFSAQLVDARFPDYAAIIPKSFGTTVVIDKAPFVRLLQVARLFAEGDKRSVDLVIRENCLRVASSRSGAGESAGDIEAHQTGAPLEISLDIGFLLESLAQIDTDQVQIEANGGHKPFCLHPLGLSRDEFLHVIMPMGK